MKLIDSIKRDIVSELFGEDDALWKVLSKCEYIFACDQFYSEGHEIRDNVGIKKVVEA